MTTENGAHPAPVVRNAIGVFERRREFLQCRIAERVAAGKPDSNGFDVSEVAAIDVALPILEAEWDAASRLRRSLSDRVGFDVMQDAHRYSEEGQWKGEWRWPEDDSVEEASHG